MAPLYYLISLAVVVAAGRCAGKSLSSPGKHHPELSFPGSTNLSCGPPGTDVCASLQNGHSQERARADRPVDGGLSTPSMAARHDIVMAGFFTHKADPQRLTLPSYKDQYTYMQGWYESVHAQGLFGIVLYDDLSDHFVTNFQSPNVQFVKVDRQELIRSGLSSAESLDALWPTEYRILGFLHYLTRNPSIEYAFLTDISDVVYQKNPFSWVRNRQEDLFYSYEAKPKMDWVEHNWKGCFEEVIPPRSIFNRLYAVGMFGGRREALLSHLTHMKHLIEDAYRRIQPNRQSGTYISGVCDMLTHNHVIHEWLDNPESQMKGRIWGEGQPLFNKILRPEYEEAESDKELRAYYIVHLNKANPLDSSGRTHRGNGSIPEASPTIERGTFAERGSPKLPQADYRKGNPLSSLDLEEAFLLQVLDGSECILPDSVQDNALVILSPMCSARDSFSWFRWLPGGVLQHLETGKCLQAQEQAGENQARTLILSTACDPHPLRSFFRLEDGAIQNQATLMCLHRSHITLRTVDRSPQWDGIDLSVPSLHNICGPSQTLLRINLMRVSLLNWDTSDVSTPSQSRSMAVSSLNLTRLMHVAVLHNPTQQYRLTHITSQLQMVGISHFTLKIGEVGDYPTSGARSMVNMLRQHRNVLDEASSVPLLLLEDDASLTAWHYRNVINVPADADAVYLGLSKYRRLEDHYWHSLGVAYEFTTVPNIARVYNMLGHHAVVITSPRYLEFLIRALDSSIRKKVHWDLEIAAAMDTYNVYSQIRPTFYQDASVGGNTEDTLVTLLQVPKVPFKPIKHPMEL